MQTPWPGQSTDERDFDEEVVSLDRVDLFVSEQLENIPAQLSRLDEYLDGDVIGPLEVVEYHFAQDAFEVVVAQQNVRVLVLHLEVLEILLPYRLALEEALVQRVEVIVGFQYPDAPGVLLVPVVYKNLRLVVLARVVSAVRHRSLQIRDLTLVDVEHFRALVCVPVEVRFGK